ncbi:hypothetical protein DC522_21710 [Microvirga sp. KLBC 81]|uniref:hypothetical protein n=1 Tax=Microvirga sp. KLBC 81 TaxID=1862707 RepID=UPI000D50CA0F|nr:hypothetical protein [Microvirga sp. KLBC 81]PVE22301.1 hypothetical protein DC522_21710 [Microvirga sp. KLBC 81]
MKEPEDSRKESGAAEPFQVKRHGKYDFFPEWNRRLFVLDGYTIYRELNRDSPQPEQQFGTRPGRKKWANRIEAEEAAKRATEGRIEGIEIAVGSLPDDYADPDDYMDANRD